MAAEAASVLDPGSQSGMCPVGVFVQVAGQAATAPIMGDIQPVFALVLAQMAAGAQLAQ